MIEKTPYELWTGKRHGLYFLKIWGCEAYAKRQASDKLASKYDKCLFVGYPKETKGYYFCKTPTLLNVIIVVIELILGLMI